MRASPGILLDADGNVIFDGEAEAMGVPAFKTRAEIEANKARKSSRSRKVVGAAASPAPEGSARRMCEHWDGGIIMEFDGVVEFDSEAERTGTPSLVGQQCLPPKKGRVDRRRPVSGDRRRWSLFR
jgi:hypothetical protein